MSRFIRSIATSSLLVAGSASADHHEPYPPDQVILHLYPDYDISEVNERWMTTTLSSIPGTDLYVVQTPTYPKDLEGYTDLMEAEDVAIMTAEPNWTQGTPESVRQMVLIAVGGDYVDFEDQGLGERIGLDPAHALSTGAGTTIALLDTGVDPMHDAFVGRLRPDGLDTVDDDTTPWEVSNGIDDDLDGTIDGGFGHGSMVGGILALTAPDAEILPVRVLDDEGRGSTWDILEGLAHVISAGDVDVINMSFGVPDHVESLAALVVQADVAGIVMVAGAGNGSSEEPAYFPARHSSVLMVTALDSTDVKADFADWNVLVDVSAPGTGVRSAYPGNGWALGSGCSFATPFVAAEAALVRSTSPLASTWEIRSAVRGGVVPIDHLPGNAPYVGQLGTGRIYVPGSLPGTVAVDDPRGGPGSRLFSLGPNPTRGVVRIRGLGGRSIDRAEVYDLAGRRVVVLEGPASTIGWDGRTGSGLLAAPGIYVVKVTSGSTTASSRLQVVR